MRPSDHQVLFQLEIPFNVIKFLKGIYVYWRIPFVWRIAVLIGGRGYWGDAPFESCPYGILSTFLVPSASVPFEEIPICEHTPLSKQLIPVGLGKHPARLVFNSPLSFFRIMLGM